MTPYFDDGKGIVIYLGDCLDLMPEFPDQSIDAAICDLPYGLTACAWDTVIPFAPMWRELKRLTKPRGAIVLFGQEPFSSLLRMSNLDWYKHDWVWDKQLSGNFILAKVRPMIIHENICVFGDGAVEYHPIMSDADQDKIKTRRIGRTTSASSIFDNRLVGRSSVDYDDAKRYPTSILSYSKYAAECNQLSRQHPTQKPLALMKYLIQTYTQPGDTVLDFAMGSGSTIRAAKDLGRKAIGIELVEAYAEIAARRLSQEVMELC